MLRRSFIGFIKGLGLGLWVIYVYFPPMIEVRAEGSFFSKPLKRGFGLGMWPMPPNSPQALNTKGSRKLQKPKL